MFQTVTKQSPSFSLKHSALLLLSLLFAFGVRAETYEGVDLGVNGDGAGLSFAMRTGNRPVFGFFNANTKELKIIQQYGASWAPEVVDTSLAQTSATATVVFQNTIHLFYFNVVSGQLWHAARNASSWTKELVDGAGAGGGVAGTVCGSQLCLSYYDAVNKNLRFARGMTGSWQTETVDGSVDDVGADSGVAADAAGRVVIAYLDATNRRVKVASKTTGAWTIDALSHPGSSFGQAPHPAITADGTVHVVAGELAAPPSGSDQGLYYARLPAGGTWAISRVNRNFTGGSNTARIRQNGTLEIAARYYRMNTNYGNWSSVYLETLDPSGIWQRTEFSGKYGASGAIYSYKNVATEEDPWGNTLVAYQFSRGAVGSDPALTAIRLHRPLDTDGDRLPDSRESLLGTNASAADSDGDHVVDGDEVLLLSTNPLAADADADQDGVRSDLDNCPTVANSSQADADLDGMGDVCDPNPNGPNVPAPPEPRLNSDGDGDGLIDSDELARGTNPQNPDTDGDGVKDGQEVLDGTNPLDKGSYLQVLAKTVCAGWSKANDTWNVLQLANTGISALNATAKVYGGSRVVATRTCAINPGSLCDVPVQDLLKKYRYTSGMVCASHDGADGALDGRLVSYRTTTTRGKSKDAGVLATTGATSFSYAFALPLANPKPGTQFVPYNIFRRLPQTKSVKSAVSNTITFLNPLGSAANGKLIIHDPTGAVSRTVRVSVPASGMKEIAGKSLSLPLYGLLEWQPDSQTSAVRLTLEQQITQTSKGKTTIAGRFVIEGEYGSGEKKTLQIDGSLFSTIELANSAKTVNHVMIYVFAADGSPLRTLAADLAPGATQLLAVEQFLSGGAKGSVRVKGSVSGGLLAVLTSIARTKEGAVNSSFAAPGVESIGTVLNGRYDTTMKQDSRIVLSNTSDQPENVSISVFRSASSGLKRRGLVFRSEQALVQGGYIVSVPARATVEVPLSTLEPMSAIGTLTVQPDRPSSIVGWVLQKKSGEYILATPLRQ